MRTAQVKIEVGFYIDGQLVQAGYQHCDVPTAALRSGDTLLPRLAIEQQAILAFMAATKSMITALVQQEVWPRIMEQKR